MEPVTFGTLGRWPGPRDELRCTVCLGRAQESAQIAGMTTPAERATEPEDARLVRLLLVMTCVTGAVDAVSILRLDRVFVANMTGNIAFLGFALAGAKGFSVSSSLVALGAFLVGAAAAGRHYTSIEHRRRALGEVAAVEALLVAAAAAVASAASGAQARYAMTVLLGVAMGVQNAFARKLAVPDLTTTVLTLTLTGLVADPWDLSHPGSRAQRRLAAVAAILLGAATGALLVLHLSTGWALLAPTVALAATAVAARASR